MAANPHFTLSFFSVFTFFYHFLCIIFYQNINRSWVTSWSFYTRCTICNHVLNFLCLQNSVIIAYLTFYCLDKLVNCRKKPLYCERSVISVIIRNSSLIWRIFGSVFYCYNTDGNIKKIQDFWPCCMGHLLYNPRISPYTFGSNVTKLL